MNKTFAIGFGVGVVLLAIGVGMGVWDSKGNHLAPTGKIGKVRTLKVDDNATIVVVDFHIRNDADVPMTVRTIEASIAVPGSGEGEGHLIAAPDLEKVFRSYPELGEQYNPALKARDQIAGHTVADRMVGIQFEAPQQSIDSRSDLTLKVEDISGPVVTLHEKSK